MLFAVALLLQTVVQDVIPELPPEPPHPSNQPATLAASDFALI